ncbi:MAG: UDP-N-acetylmuramoyl-L-alanine--D-glutamate ligase [Ketobacter sp. GenoA1]|nr:MAG: UDP-N-acetylmuramoyl-L-alanine--D-glutamate ligase [Ketobacter sp. GenoA1]RLT98189.1 MAG: UDP-N-acetylmuramoyl-L-alanine--D-glutamate ligase [Ketobacter sp.]
MDHYGDSGTDWAVNAQTSLTISEQRQGNVAKIKNKHVVIGLGKTGLSCVRFLKRLDCEVAVIDTRTEPPGRQELAQEFPTVQLYCGELEQFDLSKAQELVVSPGIAISTPAIAKAIAAGVPCSGDVELFAKSVDAPVIAVTGSNGKSTVVSIIGKALEALGYNVCVAGNIGLPVLDALSTALDVDVWVLELSSFQLETTHSLRAKIAVNLNVTEDHMDRYDSLEDYAMAKQRIFEGCEAAVYWLSDHRTKPIQAVPTLLPFGGDTQAHGRFYVDDSGTETCVMDGTKAVLTDAELHVRGAHNLLNVAACLAVIAEFSGDRYSDALPAIKAFPGLPHRCQWVADVDGVAWFNDSKGTNVGSSVAAIRGLAENIKGRLFLLAGGEGKDADFQPLATAIEEKVDQVVVFGRDAQEIADAVAGAKPVEKMENMKAAVEWIKGRAKVGDVVLFSPACASFDQFKNYEDRGHQFMTAVRG